MLFDVALNRREALLAYTVLHSASVLGGGFLGNSHRHQPLGEQQVPLVDALGDFPSLVGQRNSSVLINDNAALCPQIFHRDAHGRLREIHLSRNVNASHLSAAILQN